MAGYIGTTPVPQATQHRESFTATGGQTSFATAGYTPQFIDVYLNGVKLAPADYTATNGSDVVLASGATASDILEIVAYTPFEVANQTFTGTTTAANLTITGAFTSQGIDDNADAVAITIDSSENVGIGTTSPSGKLSISGATATNEQVHTTFTNTSGAKTFAIGAGQSGVTNNGFVIRNVTDNTFPLVISDAGVTSFGAGNVGIGTSSVTAGFVLEGVGDARFGDVAGDDAVEIGWSGGGGYAFVQAFDRGATAQRDLVLNSSLRITSDGSVAINDSSPDGKLNVVSTAHNNGSIFDSTGTTQLWLRDTDAASNQKNWGFQVSGGSLNILRANDDRASGFVTPIEIKQAPANSLVIDASGNLLVGKTSSNSDVVGVEAAQDGHVYVTVNNTLPLYINRQSGDEMLRFASNGATVGSIKSRNSESLMIGSDYGSDAYICLSNDNVFPVTSTGAVKDGATNLGVSTGRWKDLYLSGGVYLGGTGAANQLDDYEEGTWTPVMKDSTANQVIATTSTTANYTKIGRLVWVNVETTRNTGSSFTGTLKLTGLPFLASNRSGYSTNNGSAWFDGTGTDDVTTVHGGRNSTHVLFKKVEENSSYLGSAEFENTRPVYIQFWYMATDGD